MSNVDGSKGVVFVGMQWFIKSFLMQDFNGTFFNFPKELVCNGFKRRVERGLGKEIDISHIEDLHDLGYLPIRIKALPEGSLTHYLNSTG